MSKEINILDEIITSKIYLIREQKVMVDSDLDELYQVETRRLNEQIKRNIARFPVDFMFRITKEEWQNLKSQFAISSWGGRRKEPYVFTEHGVLMLSSVLNSERAIAVNIKIMRVYTKLKKMLFNNNDLRVVLKNMPCILCLLFIFGKKSIFRTPLIVTNGENRKETIQPE